MAKMSSEMCGVKCEVIGNYRGYEIAHVSQVDLYTNEPLNNGCDWYKLTNKSNPVYPLGDCISTNYEWKIKDVLDYRLDVRAKRHLRRCA